MKDNAPDETVIDRLRIALETEALPKAARDHAAHLLKRLSSPVRVSLLGRPGCGKSELVNMFVGRRLLPKDADLPTIEITHGPTEKIIVTGAKGRNTAFDSLDFEAAAKGSPAFIRAEMPLPIFERISLLEVVTDGTVDELKSAVDWAVRRTDIALWCTQYFSEEEQRLWARVPDSLKDHAFLVLAKADLLSNDNALSGRISDLETIVSEEFHSLFAVATLQAIKAHHEDGSVDESVYHASCGAALSAEILRHAERGRRADFDSAHLFLARYQISGIEGSEKPAPIAEKKEAATPVTAPQSPEPAAAVAPLDSLDPVENVVLFQDAVRLLRRRGDGLADSVSTLEPGKSGALVNQCVDAVEHLVDLFSQDDSGCPAADAFIDDLMEASDMIVLMQVESGDAPAADAVTLLLQLRRDIETRLAA
ncbi:MAG: hypothetical protein ACR2O1_13100 [Boseongicola sp.]